MSALAELRSLFQEDFVIDVDYDAAKSRKATALFQDVRDMGIHFTVCENFEDTWMGETGFTIDNWNYMGIKDGDTEIDDCDWSDRDPLEVEEFEEMVSAAMSEFQYQQSLPSSTTLTVGVNTAPVAIVLGDNLVVSGGVVVVNYKDGSSFHLEHDGKATLIVADKVVVTERTFLKDGQPAYERVTVKLESLDNIQSDTLKLTVLEDGAKVDFTTTFTL